MDSEQIFIDYSQITAWWDELESLNKVEGNKIVLNEDFTVEKKGESFIVMKDRTRLFEFHMNKHAGKKSRVELDIVAKFTVDQFEIVYPAFTSLIEESFSSSRQDSIIKEVVESPNEEMTTNELAKKYAARD